MKIDVQFGDEYAIMHNGYPVHRLDLPIGGGA